MKIFFTPDPVDSAVFLRRALALYGIDSPDIRRTPRGKPYLADGRVKFSLTHTDGLAAVAVGASETGIDAERRKPRKLNALLSRLTPAERNEDFYELWTAKEAYVKYCGGTLADMLFRLEYKEGRLYRDGAAVPCAFSRFELEGCAVCLCTERAEETTLIRI